MSNNKLKTPKQAADAADEVFEQKPAAIRWEKRYLLQRATISKILGAIEAPKSAGSPGSSVQALVCVLSNGLTTEVGQWTNADGSVATLEVGQSVSASKAESRRNPGTFYVNYSTKFAESRLTAAEIGELELMAREASAAWAIDRTELEKALLQAQLRAAETL